jgi:hypothetical protein
MRAAVLFLVMFASAPLALVNRAVAQSWIFAPGHFTHDPQTGARVAQYQRIAPVEELPDPRHVTSGYRRTRTQIRGTDGTLDTSYQVQSFGNGRGGLDAEWERVNDAWLDSSLSGSFYQQQGNFHNGPGFRPGGGPGGWHGGWNGGWQGGWNGNWQGGGHQPIQPPIHGPWAPRY